MVQLRIGHETRLELVPQQIHLFCWLVENKGTPKSRKKRELILGKEKGSSSNPPEQQWDETGPHIHDLE